MPKLTLEFDHDYALIAIHTSEEDYRLAYLLNKNMQTLFCKSVKNLDFKQKEDCFSVFLFEDTKTSTSQFLIANKYLGTNNNKNTNNLFGTTFTQVSYLIPEQKKIDFFLKIEGDILPIQLEKITQKINLIPQVLTCYTVNPLHLKSKNALIF